MSNTISFRCITGTPIHRGIEDLFGLFVFLKLSPYNDKAWWRAVFGDSLRDLASDSVSTQRHTEQYTQSSDLASKLKLIPFAPQAPLAAVNRLVALLQSIFWRHSMKQVQTQLQLPPISETVHTLKLSAVERVFYDQQRLSCSGDFRKLTSQLKRDVEARWLRKSSSALDKTSWMEQLSKQQWRRVLVTLGRLRQACCHPQVLPFFMLRISIS